MICRCCENPCYNVITAILCLKNNQQSNNYPGFHTRMTNEIVNARYFMNALTFEEAPGKMDDSLMIPLDEGKKLN